MKRNLILMAASLTALTGLTGCGNQSSVPSSAPSSEQSTPSKFTYKDIELIVPDDNQEPKRDGTKLKMLFKDSSSEVPYISLSDGFGLLNALKGVRGNDPKNQKYFFRLTGDDKKIVVNNESGLKATFDYQAQTIVYDDFDSFLTLRPETSKPLTIFDVPSTSKAFKITSCTFKKGNALTIDFKSYSRVDMVSDGKMIYLPVATFNDCFYSVFELADLVYNYKDLYLVPNGSLKSSLFGVTALTGFGESFYGGPKKDTLSEELKEFQYQESCLNFDYFYGLKKEKGFTSFASFVEGKGLKDDLLNTDTRKADAGLRYALSHLNDGHTAGTETSVLYPYGTASDVKEKYSKGRFAWVEYGEDLEKERQKADISSGNYLDEIGKCYYITFDTFSAVDEDLLYMADMAGDEIPAEALNASTAIQFHSAYKFLTDSKNKDKAKTVVVDLLTNSGGSADSLIYSLCTLLGEVKTSMISPITAAENRTTYKADLNLDGKIDEQDVGLIQKGYNVVFLDSKATFSSGNALPAIAKANNAKVMTVGETSGGGTCAVRPAMSALGASYSVSGVSQIAVEKEGKLTNVEAGVPADHAVDRASFFERMFLSTMINAWFAE